MVLMFITGEIWFFFFVFPLCIGFRNRYQETNESEREENQEPIASGETAPYVDVQLNENSYENNSGLLCPRCRTKIKEENVRFCPNCGKKL